MELICAAPGLGTSALPINCILDFISNIHHFIFSLYALALRSVTMFGELDLYVFVENIGTVTEISYKTIVLCLNKKICCNIF